MNETVKTKIQTIIDQNDVVLFMKGNSKMPQCGFSSRVAGILNYLEVNFKDVNVLEDDEIRQGIKDFSDWPTIPQLYVKNVFIGGFRYNNRNDNVWRVGRIISCKGSII